MSILLQQALRHHQSGELEKAKSLYKEFLGRYPKDINGLQLLGTLYAAQDKFPQAISLLESSLEQKSGQPQVLLNLAITYKRAGQSEKAQKLFRQIIAIQPENKQAYQNLIKLLAESNAIQEAFDVCDEAIRVTQQSDYFLLEKAELMSSIQRYDDAIAIYQSLLSQHPNKPEFIHGMALALRQNGDSKKALSLYQMLIQQGVSSFQLFHNLGNALSDLGQLTEAISYYEKAIELKPGYVHSHINLNELLWEVGQKQRFLTSYLQAIPLQPHNMPLKFAYCQSLLRTSNYDICLKTLEEVDPQLRHFAQYWDLIARAEKGLGNNQRCLAHYKTAAEQADVGQEIMLNYAQALIEAQKIDDAQDLLESIVKDSPDDQFAWSLLGLCWRINDDPRERQLNNYNELVGEFEIDTPPGFESIQEYCRQLNDYLTELHTGTNQPVEQTLTGGTQTRGNLFDNPHPLIQALAKELRKCISKFIENSASFEFVQSTNASQTFEFSGSWSVQLKDKGFHTSHIHPMGWLSSAFYVSLPDVVADSVSKQGWFCLGKPNIKTTPKLDAVRQVQPTVGKLVLFRSYMWHSTTAFASAHNRTTVAFDVIKSQ